MKVLNEIAQICESKFAQATPTQAFVKVPSAKYAKLQEELNPFVSKSKGLNTITLTLSFGELKIIPYSGTTIEVQFGK